MVADPGADFADLTILRLGLSGQRRQAAEATRWLDQDDRELLALWWLEAAGELDRSELATATGLSTAHAAVRIQRMLAQLDAARAVVGALGARPRCPELDDMVASWDGVPTGLWRKRIARHTRDCVRCNGAWAGLVPVHGLPAMALVPVPAVLTAALVTKGLLSGGTGTATALVASATTTGTAASAAGKGGVLAWLGQFAVTKPVVAVAASITVAAGTAGAVQLARPDKPDPPAAISLPSATPPRSTPTSIAPAATVTASPSTLAPVYGSVIDVADAAPPVGRKPRTLPKRPEGTLKVIASGDNDPRPEVSSFVHRGEWVTLSGRGYIRLEWQVPFQVRAGGIVPPSWTGLKGKLFHVASGGGHRMDDRIPGQAADHTYLGNPEQGQSTVPDGAQVFWRFEYYYLDGEVTFTQRESGGDYNIYLHLVDRQTITADITTAPGGDQVRYGLTRDTGTDAAPVPQYVTRSTDPAKVVQKSNV